MPRKIITISLPPAFHDFVERRIRAEGYSSTSEYFRELIRRDQRCERIAEEARANDLRTSYPRRDLGSRRY